MTKGAHPAAEHKMPKQHMKMNSFIDRNGFWACDRETVADCFHKRKCTAELVADSRVVSKSVMGHLDRPYCTPF